VDGGVELAAFEVLMQSDFISIVGHRFLHLRYGMGPVGHFYPPPMPIVIPTSLVTITSLCLIAGRDCCSLLWNCQASIYFIITSGQIYIKHGVSRNSEP
jgi:hypothetical protein